MQTEKEKDPNRLCLDIIKYKKGRLFFFSFVNILQFKDFFHRNTNKKEKYVGEKHCPIQIQK